MTGAVERPVRRIALAAVRDAAIIVVISLILSVSVNAIRSTGAIALVAEEEYQVLVPCPEHEGKPAEAAAAATVKLGEEGVLMVDARDVAKGQWSVAGAVSIPYDFLEPTSPEILRKVLDSRAKRVVVFGDGDNPDTGEQLASELSGHGIRNVVFVQGGAPALKKAQGGQQ